MTTAAILTPPELVLIPGSDTTCLLTLYNNTNIVEGYRVEVLGDASSWATVDNPSPRLYPGTEISLTITFRMPESSRLFVREIPFAVRVVPMERPSDTVVPEGIIRIGSVTDLGGELLPESSTSRRTAFHDIAIDNNGNDSLSVQIRGSDQDENLIIKAQPDSLVIPPGQAMIARLKVRHQRLIWKGSPTPRKFRVSLSSPEAKPLVLHGTCVQRPIIGSWMWKTALALVALALLLAGLWMGLMKPAVKSAADKAAQDAVASAAPNTNKGGSGGGAGSDNAVSGEKAPGLSPSASSASPSAAPASSTASYSQTITIEAGPGKTVKKDIPRPPKTRLQVSYFQIQASQGDTATLNILNGDQLLFPYQLYNIRIYDVHQQPPIEIPADKVLRLELKCANPGTDPQGKAYPSCRTDVQFTGTTFTAN